LKITF